MPYSRLNARALFCSRGEHDTLAMALRLEQSEEKLHHAKVINVLVLLLRLTLLFRDWRSMLILR